MNSEEIFNLVDKNGDFIGEISRKIAHSSPDKIHRSVHCFVLNSNNEIYLQKRDKNKDIQPDKWDTSVGGHVSLNESIIDAVKRETSEELNIEKVEFKHLYQYLWTSKRESELVNTYMINYDGVITFDINEISEGRFWSKEEIENNLGKNVFTNNFEFEWKMFKDFLSIV